MRTPTILWRWEKGKTQIPDEAKLRLAKLYEVEAAHLMGWTENGAGAPKTPRAVDASRSLRREKA